MRTFIAIPISSTEALQSAMSELQSMRPALKMISFDQLHVTTAFLGETDESQVPHLAEIVQEIAGSVFVPRLILRGLGAFPSLSRPTVVWVGFANPDALIRLADQLASRCEQLGFVRE